MRSIQQPGPPAPERIQWVEARGRAFSFALQAGVPLLEGARRGFAAQGFAGGVLNIRDGALGPLPARTRRSTATRSVPPASRSSGWAR
jgi:hypothetical protein